MQRNHRVGSCRSGLALVFAQSNVTVYGIADAGIGSWSAGSSANQRTTVFTSGGMSASRLGFKGEEALAMPECDFQL